MADDLPVIRIVDTLLKHAILQDASDIHIEQMETELQAGAWKVIGEARESGTVGIFRGSGEVRSGLVAEIIRKIPQADVIWEAPKKEQQVWFIQLYGTNVNLGNIAPNEIIPLETLRMGLRGDSFHFFLNP
mgnify:CR=1 FL=1